MSTNILITSFKPIEEAISQSYTDFKYVSINKCKIAQTDT